jgi:hypothetical protein
LPALEICCSARIGKSVVGGLADAILAIKILKRMLGITGSTGLRFETARACTHLAGPVRKSLSALQGGEEGAHAAGVGR